MDTAVHTLADVTERPVVVSHVPSHYRQCLQDAGEHGREIVSLIIDTAGHVEPGSVSLEGDVDPILDSIAVEDARGFLFRPARVKGQAVRVTVSLPLDFGVNSTPVADSGVFSLACVDEAPQVAKAGPPPFPAIMPEQPTSGTARVAFVVDSSGAVMSKSIRVLGASSSTIRSVALAMVRAIRFTPAKLGGRAVAVHAMLPVVYQSCGESPAPPPREPGGLDAIVVTACPR